MCQVCRQTPCHPACPNAPEPAPVHICSECGYGIFSGDRFLKTGKGYICEGCLEDMALETLLSVLGEELETAEERSCFEWA